MRYCGIALQNRDSSLVSFTDKEETARVRDNFLKKKLGLTASDADLDKAIQAAAEKMKADRTRNRVTVYYLLAEHFERSWPTSSADRRDSLGACRLGDRANGRRYCVAGHSTANVAVAILPTRGCTASK